MTSEPSNGNTLRYRVEENEKDIETLGRKVDRLIWALVGLSISLATSAVVLALTIAAGQR